MYYKVMELSNYIVSKCIDEGEPISNLQLQKILYYIQKAFLQKSGGRVAFWDDIEAWQFGPVVPNVYYHFCGFGAMPITIKSLNSACTIKDEDKALVDTIIESKRRLDPWELVSETHKPEGAWAQIYRNGEGNHEIIPVELIKAVG